MIRLADIRHIHFIGIGGIGMSALARYFQFRGAKVSGYDRTATVLTRKLEEEGMQIVYVDDDAQIQKEVDAVVYTPAIPSTHIGLSYYREHHYPVLKRSDVLGIISADSFNICVAGTHGKTTISTMIAHLLRDSGYGCNAFLGGISANYQTNFWHHSRNVCVIEADEYDRSFLKLSPDIAVISAMDPDHLEIYGTAAIMESAYIDFAGKIREKGMLLRKKGLARETELQASIVKSYSLEDKAGDVHAENIEIKDGYYSFDVVISGKAIKDLAMYVGGLHNVENMTAAVGVAFHLGISVEKIRDAVASYRGVKRRFEYGVQNHDFVYLDDYAHHPEELSALIRSVRGLYPNRRLIMVFQPHLFTRTRDFADQFAAVLDMVDELFLLPIYPARELPIEGVTNMLISERMKKANVHSAEKSAVMEWIGGAREIMRGEAVLVTAGAGDIDQMVEPIKKILLA